MRWNKRLGSLCVLVLMTLPLIGCMRAAKQGLSEILGAQGEEILLIDLDRARLANCKSVRFDPVTTTLTERVCPRRLLSEYDQAYADRTRELSEAGFTGGEPALRVSTEVLYFEEKGLLGEAQLLARVKMYEAGRMIGDLLAKTVSESFRDSGVAAMTEENTKVVRRLFLK